MQVDPFLLLDHLGPVKWGPGEGIGAPDHPHRGFETVTYMLDGHMLHEDHLGNRGDLRSGDVQWMTAGRGIIHSEMPEQEQGLMWGFQLWVNLPAKDKAAKPGYQSITSAQIPDIALPAGGGRVRVIAGTYAGETGPARTFTPMNVWDVRLNAEARVELPVPDGHTTAVFVLSGRVRLASGEDLGAAELALFERKGAGIAFEALADTKLLVLDGAPIDEPIVGYGPFVMNSEREIHQAFLDYQGGKMGRIAVEA